MRKRHKTHQKRHQIACCFSISLLLPSLLYPYYIFKMARCGPELNPQMRARICELRSFGWSYNKIKKKHLEIPRITIADTCRQESKRLNNALQPRPGAPRVITEEQRDMLYDEAISAPSISHEALQAQVAPNASIRLIKRLLQEMNIRK
jgi:hypothetical protein